MKCIKCDKQIGVSSFLFCPYCGTAVENDTPEALLQYIESQIERLEKSGKEHGRWIKWRSWIREKIS